MKFANYARVMFAVLALIVTLGVPFAFALGPPGVSQPDRQAIAQIAKISAPIAVQEVSTAEIQPSLKAWAQLNDAAIAVLLNQKDLSPERKHLIYQLVLANRIIDHPLRN